MVDLKFVRDKYLKNVDANTFKREISRAIVKEYPEKVCFANMIKIIYAFEFDKRLDGVSKISQDMYNRYKEHLYNFCGLRSDYLDEILGSLLHFYDVELISTVTTIERFFATEPVSKDSDDVSISRYVGPSNIKSIEIPKTLKGKRVVGVSKDAFKNCKKLEYVKFPSTIMIIDDRAFYGCINLKQLNFPKDLKKIGEKAFAKCLNLQRVDFPDGTESLGLNAFDGCVNLNILKMSKALKECAWGTFGTCINLQHVYIPGNTDNKFDLWFKETGIFTRNSNKNPKVIIYCNRNTELYKHIKASDKWFNVRPLSDWKFTNIPELQCFN